MSDDLPSPWREFLTELDTLLTEPIALHCMGGFAVVVGYGLLRSTGDLDYRTLEPYHLRDEIQELAGLGSELHKKHRVYLQRNGGADIPEDYEDRLTEIYGNKFRNIKLMLVDPYDLILSKLGRNIDRDRQDVEYLAATLKLDANTLRARYQKELRSIMIGRASWHDQTLEFWVEAYFS